MQIMLAFDHQIIILKVR